MIGFNLRVCHKNLWHTNDYISTTKSQGLLISLYWCVPARS